MIARQSEPFLPRPYVEIAPLDLGPLTAALGRLPPLADVALVAAIGAIAAVTMVFVTAALAAMLLLFVPPEAIVGLLGREAIAGLLGSSVTGSI